VAACVSIPYVSLLKDIASCGLIVGNTGCSGAVTRDDLELVKWIDENIPPEKGLIGLTAYPIRAGNEKHLYPVGGSQALLLYGKHYNICFFQLDPGRSYGFDDYVAHVYDAFDPQWCLDNNIHFFYVAGIYYNQGIVRAIVTGALRPVKVIGGSGLYEPSPP
jgi:hypothetical protein